MARDMASEHEWVRDLLRRAHDLMCQCEYDEAVVLAQQATALAPRSLDAWRELGSACGYAGRAKEMEHAFEQALRVAVTPIEEFEVWFSRGIAENSCSLWEDALRSFGRLAELEPEWGTPWLMRGMVLSNMGTFVDRRYYEEAVLALDHALEMPPVNRKDERVIYSLKAKSLAGLGRSDEADRCARKAAEMWQAEQTEQTEQVKSEARREVH